MSFVLADIFGDGAVLQRDKTIFVHGTCDKVEGEIVARILDSKKKVVATSVKTKMEEVEDKDAPRRFLIEFESQKAGGPYTLEVSDKGSTVSIKKVYIGEVWVAGGQSNMEMPLQKTEGAQEELEAAEYDGKIHYYCVHCPGEEGSQADFKWTSVDVSCAKNMSAIGYYFMKRIREEIKDCHVAIIGCFSGGTSVSSWQSVESLEKTIEGKKMLAEFEENCAGISDKDFEVLDKEYRQAKAKWIKDYDEYALKYPNLAQDDIQKFVGECPWPPPFGKKSYRRPGGLYEDMLLKFAPYGVKGVIFYQGEEDANEHADRYGDVFKTMIEEWRNSFLDEELPFIYAQLPMYIDHDRKFMGFEDYKWPKLRQEQLRISQEVENTWIAILTDCGEFDNLHPIDKKTPANRLALLALHYVYGKTNIKAMSPRPIDIRNSGVGAVEISFAGDFNMLLFKGFEESGFQMCGPDGEYIDCNASIDMDGKSVSLYSPTILAPYKVRYAWFSYGKANLVTETGLAIMPFEMSVVKSLGS